MLRCYGWGSTSEYRLKIGDCALTGAGWPKFQVEGVAPTNHSSSQKTRLNDLSYGMKMWTDLSSILSQFTRLTDRRTDRILIARPCLHSMQRDKNRNRFRVMECDISAGCSSHNVCRAVRVIDWRMSRPLLQLVNSCERRDNYIGNSVLNRSAASKVQSARCSGD